MMFQQRQPTFKSTTPNSWIIKKKIKSNQEPTSINFWRLLMLYSNNDFCLPRPNPFQNLFFFFFLLWRLLAIYLTIFRWCSKTMNEIFHSHSFSHQERFIKLLDSQIWSILFSIHRVQQEIDSSRIKSIVLFLALILIYCIKKWKMVARKFSIW